MAFVKTYQNLKDFGYTRFLSSDELFDPANSHIKDDTLTIQADVSVCMGHHAVIDCLTRVKRQRVTEPDGAQGSVPGPKPQIGHLSQEVAQLWETRLLSDFVLISNDDTEFPVHRVILAISSEVFSAMLKPHTQEAICSRCVINDTDSETLKALLEYVYTGATDRVPDLAEKLLIAADKYALSGLVDACVEYLAGTLTTHNAAKLLIRANEYRIDKLTAAVCHFLGITHDQGNDS